MSQSNLSSSTLHPWSVIRAIVLEHSSYEVPKIIDLTGLKVNWALTEAQNYSDKLRISAYRPRIDAAYHELDEGEQLRAVYILVGELAKRGLAEKLESSLQPIGWRLDEGRLAPEGATVRELFFPKQSQHDAYIQIRNIIQAATTSITFVDPYVDQTLLTLAASALKPGMQVQILTAQLPHDFSVEAKAWQAQHSNASLEVRTTREFHDRFIVVDEEICWHIGCSIKDAGSKIFMLSNVEDNGNRTALISQVHASWRVATPKL